MPIGAVQASTRSDDVRAPSDWVSESEPAGANVLPIRIYLGKADEENGDEWLLVR